MLHILLAIRPNLHRSLHPAPTHDDGHDHDHQHDMATLPPPLSNLSLWQRTVRSHPLLSSNATTPLPESADTIVVGGGLMGALIAHHLLERHPHHKVVLLEARELASGASGRNAGHCRPDAARGFTTFAKLHGGEQARKIIESEAEVLKLYVWRQRALDGVADAWLQHGRPGQDQRHRV